MDDLGGFFNDFFICGGEHLNSGLVSGERISHFVEGKALECSRIKSSLPFNFLNRHFVIGASSSLLLILIVNALKTKSVNVS